MGVPHSQNGTHTHNTHALANCRAALATLWNWTALNDLAFTYQPICLRLCCLFVQRDMLRAGWVWRSGDSALHRLERSDSAAAKKIVGVTSKLKEEMEELKENWETSQDPRVWKMRDAADRVFGETEIGHAIGEIMRADPTFELHTFLMDMENYMIPVIVEAFRRGDQKLLIQCVDGNARHQVWATFKERDIQKVDWDDRILDIRALDLAAARVIDDVPCLSVSFVCQHVNCHRAVKDGTIVQGSEVSDGYTRMRMGYTNDDTQCVVCMYLR